MKPYTPAQKTALLLLALLVAMSIASAAPPFQESTQTGQLTLLYPKVEVFKQYESETLHFHVLNSTNRILTANNVSCMVHLYDPDNDHVLDTNLVSDGEDYEFSANTTETGRYAYNVWCNSTTEGGYVSGYYDVSVTGKIEPVEGRFLAGAIALIPLIFSLLLLLGAFHLEEEHQFFKHFLFLFSFISTWISIYLANLAVIKFYDWPDMQGALGDVTYWFAILFAVIVAYFLIYYIAMMIKTAADNKEDKLNYK